MEKKVEEIKREWEGLKNGDTSVLKEIYRKASRPIISRIIRIYKITEEEAQDILQDSIITLYNTALLENNSIEDNIKNEISVFSVLDRIVYFNIKKRPQSTRRIDSFSEMAEIEDAQIEVTDPLEDLINKELTLSLENAVKQTLSNFDETERDVITKRYFLNEKLDAISKELGITERRVSRIISVFKRDVINFLSTV